MQYIYTVLVEQRALELEHNDCVPELTAWRLFFR